jgi:HAMP domain-containing protein
MKIRDLILIVLIVGMVLSTGILVAFTSSGISDVKATTSEASSGELLGIASENLKSVAIGIRNSLDSQMQNQYEMVKTWAQSPALTNVAKAAQKYTKEQLYEMWSAEATREYDDGEAVGDGNPNNDLDPSVSEYLAKLTKTTAFPEIFITDSRGYAIAANAATGDFDQGPDDWRIFLEDGVPVFKKHGPSEGGEGWYKATNESPDGFYVSEITWDDSARTWGLEIMSQLREPETNEYLGQIKAVFDYGTFIDQFVGVEDLDVYEIKVVDKAGTIVATSLDDKSKVNNDDVNVRNSAYFLNAMSGISGADTGAAVDENGQSVYAGSAISQDVNGHIVVVTKKAADVASPVDAFTGNLQSAIGDKSSSLQTSMIIVGLVVAAVIIVLATLIIRSKVSLPLKKLTAVSDKLSKGEIDGLSIDVQGRDEIGSFGESFKGVLAAFNFLKDEAEKKQ